MIPYSILDLAPINQGETVAEAFANSVKLASVAEEANYKRIWLAEHHGMKGIASAATAVVLSHIGANTKHIRIGAGGIMLPNHSPLAIAEQFGTLAELYGNRIDLGLGRAPGTDMSTARALRRKMDANIDDYPQDIQELQKYFTTPDASQRVIAVPGAGTQVPIWLLGSSLYSAQLAAQLGLPYSFASHFAPHQLMEAISLYRRNFQPSEKLERPYVMVGLMAVAADTNDEANYLFSSVQQKFIDLQRGKNEAFSPPFEDIDSVWTPTERQFVNQTLSMAAVGTKEKVSQKLQQIIEVTEADELIISTPIYDIEAKLDSVKTISDIHLSKSGS